MVLEIIHKSVQLRSVQHLNVRDSWSNCGRTFTALTDSRLKECEVELLSHSISPNVSHERPEVGSVTKQTQVYANYLRTKNTQCGRSLGGR